MPAAELLFALFFRHGRFENFAEAPVPKHLVRALIEADGQACQGMTALCAQLSCKVAGIGIGIEKGFMPGGRNLRAMGVHLESLAVVTGIEDGKILLADD